MEHPLAVMEKKLIKEISVLIPVVMEHPLAHFQK